MPTVVDSPSVKRGKKIKATVTPPSQPSLPSYNWKVGDLFLYHDHIYKVEKLTAPNYASCICLWRVANQTLQPKTFWMSDPAFKRLVEGWNPGHLDSGQTYYIGMLSRGVCPGG